jgi:hypothetical protein
MREIINRKVDRVHEKFIYRPKNILVLVLDMKRSFLPWENINTIPGEYSR